ncbi:MAG: hypothetical protein EPO68_16470 [Planctomycetota bacterium]|nr:MAG: hypothetical protein EPO68_16470 [Planctomycetota bacterium]
MTDSAELPSTNVENDHNVYILGAGFSADRGLPLVRGFLDKLRDSLDVAQSRERAAIEAVLRFRQEAAGSSDRITFDTENVEDLFSLAVIRKARAIVEAIPLAIAATIQAAEQQHPHKQVGLRLGDFTRGCARVIRERCPEYNQHGSAGHRVPLYALYLASMCGLLAEKTATSTNTIVTFNYDLLVEEAASLLGLHVDYGLTSPLSYDARSVAWTSSPATRPTGQSLRVLKLHGSLNWVSDPQQRHDSNSVGVVRDFGAVQELGRVPLLIPPVWNKSVSSALEPVWDKAVSALESATRVAVIGHSLAASDGYFKYLLAAGLTRNVSLRHLVFVGYEPERFRFFAGYPGGPSSEPRQQAPSEFETRVSALVRRSRWTDERVITELQGTRDFVLSRLNGGAWNRNWDQRLTREDLFS